MSAKTPRSAITARVSIEWLFGYGSVIYRPSFSFVERANATLRGVARRFSQRSDDHRGTAEFPGRVVTLREREGGVVRGAAFRFDPREAGAIIAGLDDRERAGYERAHREVTLDDGRCVRAIVYIAPPGNDWDAGDEPEETIASVIQRARGPSGTNADYLRLLADALRSLGDRDPHVLALEGLVFGPSR